MQSGAEGIRRWPRPGSATEEDWLGEAPALTEADCDNVVDADVVVIGSAVAGSAFRAWRFGERCEGGYARAQQDIPLRWQPGFSS
ncbi:MAG: hypothetical protein ACLTSX_13605 [Collinsella sp.]